jgi:hypothetical protein
MWSRAESDWAVIELRAVGGEREQNGHQLRHTEFEVFAKTWVW